MKDFLIKIKSGKLMLAFMLLMALTVASTDLYSLSYGGKPQKPRLSLTGAGDGFNSEWYPDGKIWLPIAANGTREFLMPVFIDNRYDTRILRRTTPPLPDTIHYVVEPIKSFRFKIMYDSSALRVVGVQATNPDNAPVDLSEQPLANSFNISWSDSADTKYMFYVRDGSLTNPVFNGPTSPDALRGRSVTITGSSDKALANTYNNPNNPDQGINYKVLVYVKFRVVPKSIADLTTSGLTPVYISPDEIMYNNWNAAKDPILPYYKENANSAQQWASDYTGETYTPAVYYGQKTLANVYVEQTRALAGINNISEKEGNPSLPPNPWGCLWVKYMLEPRVEFTFKSNRAIDPPKAISKLPRTVNGQVEEDPSNWEILTPLTVDNNPSNPGVATREMELGLEKSGTRATNVTIESDSPWLLFSSKKGAAYKSSPSMDTPTRSGYINWLDNGILGKNGLASPTVLGGDAPEELVSALIIQCDPSKLTGSGEKEGIHVGYLTFKSDFASIAPTRVKVTFIYFKAPNEGQRAGVAPGIKIKMRNSKPVTPDTTMLIFGTGPRATNGIDSLYGEFPIDNCVFCAETNPRKFGAAFFPYRMKPADSLRIAKKGFGDFSKNDEQPYSSSRDIRSVDDTTESITYLVNFYANGDANYPVTLEWDLRDFPDGANLFLKDNLNGGGFPAVDMRNTTVTGQYTRSFVIQDPKITSFLIEYTLPTVVNYVDGNGLPIIKTGWNMLSMPVKPTNTNWKNIYKNAIAKPYNYALGNYQENDVLSAGVGYFVKYGATIDKQFSGSVITEISPAVGNTVKLWPGDAGKGGWNSVGGLSFPTSITNIDFEKFGTIDLPNKNYTLKFGVWTYTTNNGYFEVSEIKPGLGYFIKVDKDGYYKLTNNNIKLGVNSFTSEKEAIYNASTAINVVDNSNSKSVVYLSNNTDLEVENFEMPPAPSTNMFDVRFGTTNSNLVNKDNAVISMQGVTYPVSISAKNAHSNLTFVDAVTGEVFGNILKGTDKNIEIKSSSSAVRVIATESNDDASAFVNYPNPVNNNTNFNYSVANNGNVTIEIYNQVGTLVATVVNEFKKAGNHTVSFDASNLPSGSYVAKFNSNGTTATRTISVVK